MMKSLIGIVCIINIHFVWNFKKNESFVSVIEVVEEHGDFCMQCESSKNVKELLLLMKDKKMIYSSFSPLKYWIRSVDSYDTGKYHCIAQEKYIKTVKLIMEPSKKIKWIEGKQKKLKNDSKINITDETDNSGDKNNNNETEKLWPHLRYIERRPLSTKICFEYKLYIDNRTENYPIMEYIVNLKHMDEYNSMFFKEDNRYCIEIFVEAIDSWSFNGRKAFENMTNAYKINISKLKSNSLPLSIIHLNFDDNIFTFYKKSLDDDRNTKLNIIDMADNSQTKIKNMTSIKSTIVKSMMFNKIYCLFLSYYDNSQHEHNPPCTIILYTELLNNKSSKLSKIPPAKDLNSSSNATEMKLANSKIYMILNEIGIPKKSNGTFIKTYRLLFINPKNYQQSSTRSIKLFDKLLVNYQYNASDRFKTGIIQDGVFSSKVECGKDFFSVEIDYDKIIIHFHPHEYSKTQLKGYVVSIISQTKLNRYHVDLNKENFTFIDNSWLFILKNITVRFLFEDQSCLYVEKKQVKPQKPNLNPRSFLKVMQQPEILLIFVYIPVIAYLILNFFEFIYTGSSRHRTYWGYCSRSNHY